MRRLILQMQVSVDGFMSSADPGIRWQVWNWADPWTWDETLRRDFNATFAGVDTLLLSRKMAQQGYLDHWQQVADSHPADPDYAFARRIADLDKVVVSRTLTGSSWPGAVVTRQDLPDEVQALKQQPGQDIIAFGGVGLASSLVAANLVDEFQFYLNPTAVGAGRTIFDGLPGYRLRLTGSAGYGCGIVVNRYAPA